jgi:hypothetical protein
MKAVAERHYATFDEQRRAAEAVAADREDMQELEDAEKSLLQKPKDPQQ